MRRNGFDPPYSTDQVTSSALFVLMVVYFCAMCAFTFSKTILALIYVSYGVLLLIFLGLWVFLECENPSNRGGMVFKGKLNQDVERYCPLCRKTIAGFDHHCTWLNTCIGKRNYFQFYMLTFFGLLFFIFQTTIGLIAVFVSLSRDDSDQKFGSFTAGIAAWGVHDVLSFGIGSLFASLFGFHTYLMFNKKGTYDWVIDGQSARDAKRNLRQAKLKQASIKVNRQKQDGQAKESLEPKETVHFVDHCSNLCKNSFGV